LSLALNKACPPNFSLPNSAIIFWAFGLFKYSKNAKASAEEFSPSRAKQGLSSSSP